MNDKNRPDGGDRGERPESPWAAAEAALGYKPGGPLNIGWHCSDRLCAHGKAGHTALIWESLSGEKTYTFDELRLASDAAAAFLRGLGLRQGDRVCLLMDRVPEMYFFFLGILKAGAVAQPLFPAFGDEALAARLADAETRFVVTQGRQLPKLRRLRARLPRLERVVVAGPGEAEPPPEDAAFFSAGAAPVKDFRCADTRADSPSVLHYTSGSTGRPKGVRHTHYSLVSQSLTAALALDLRDGDVYWCTAEPGWVTGTSYGIIGPWSLGVTQCALDAGFTAENWYGFMEKRRITVLYTAPTALRALMRAGPEAASRHDLSGLRHLASVGEPLDAGAVEWSDRVLGRPAHDTYWQTETGSIMIANLPGVKIKPGSMGKPLPGITAALLDPKSFKPLAEPGRAGLLAFRPDWPARMTGYWNDAEAYRAKFRDGWYISGDRASRDADGYYWFAGRDDDIINTAGHLVSPFEVESALLGHPAVAEAAAVSRPDPVNLEVVKAFVVLKPGYSAGAALELELMNLVRRLVSPLAMPAQVEFAPRLPKTRSGKTLRRLLRAGEWGQPGAARDEEEER